MRYLALLLVLALALTGCVRTYTFKKERVDQDLAGNRGYLEGEAPPASARLEVPKRTIIGIDIELPPYEEEEPVRPKRVTAEERIMTREVPEEKPEYEKKRGTEIMPAKKIPETIKGEAVEEKIEEEWIK